MLLPSTRLNGAEVSIFSGITQLVELIIAYYDPSQLVSSVKKLPTLF
jgi:hypothetical protein